jgi:hypothetical protein
MFVLPIELTAVVVPVPGPSNCTAGGNDSTGQVAERRRSAPGGCTVTLAITLRQATHGRGFHSDVARGQPTLRAAEKANQPVSSIHATDRRTWLTRSTAFIDFAGGYPSNANFGSFRTPDRAVPIPHGNGRTLENVPWRHDRRPRIASRRKEVRSDKAQHELGRKLQHDLPFKGRRLGGSTLSPK